jgi:hypothetical protein
MRQLRMLTREDLQVNPLFIVIPPGRIEFRKRSEWTISTNRHPKTCFFPRFQLGEKTFCCDDITILTFDGLTDEMFS